MKQVPGFNDDYDNFLLSVEARAALKPDKNLIAMHCHQTTGGQYIDMGFIPILRDNHHNVLFYELGMRSFWYGTCAS
jgi:hypothetical protein